MICAGELAERGPLTNSIANAHQTTSERAVTGAAEWRR
jgi:hypothetical protein